MFKNKVQFTPGGYYHIYNRSINYELVFAKKSMRRAFKRIIKKWLGPFVKIKSYAILEDHYHFFLKHKSVTPKLLKKAEELGYKACLEYVKDHTNNDLYSLFISRLYQSAIFEFSKLYNKSMKRKGHVMQQRFRRKEVQALSVPYLIAYVQNNPRHHGLVDNLDDWENCSHADQDFRSWVKNFGKKKFSELAEGKGTGYKNNAGLYYRLLEIVQQMKMKSIVKVPSEIWSELHQLLGAKKEQIAEIRRQTKYLINFERPIV